MNRKATYAILLTIFFIVPPLVAATSSGSVIVSKQEDIGTIINQFIAEGAEVLAVNIDPTGEPLVIYGQLGLPSDALDLTNDMYDGCLALAVVSTRGEFMEYVMNMVGGLFGNLSNPNNVMDSISSKQFESGMNMDDIFQMLGTDFGLLLSAYLNVDAATSSARMGQVLAKINSEFQLSFSELTSIRIDDTMFPPDADVQLPFDSLDLYVYQIGNTFEDSLNLIMSGLDSSGLLGAIDIDTFANARGSAGGLLAIPDMSLIAGMFGNSTPLTFPISGDFSIAQDMPTGPLSIAAIGYNGDQVVSLGDTSLSLKSLIGATGSLTPLSQNTFIIAHLAGDVNITSVSPNDPQYTMFDPNYGSVFWNASNLGSQNDYLINFESDDYPPEIAITRAFSIDSITVGGSVEVTITVTNNADVAVSNVLISDTGLAPLYPTADVSGDTTMSVSTLAPHENVTMTYTVTFANEGGYLFPGAILSYEYNSRTFTKSTPDDGFTVNPDAGAVAGQVIGDAMEQFPEITLGIFALIALTGIYSVLGIIKGRGGSDIVTV